MILSCGSDQHQSRCVHHRHAAESNLAGKLHGVMAACPRKSAPFRCSQALDMYLAARRACMRQRLEAVTSSSDASVDAVILTLSNCAAQLQVQIPQALTGYLMMRPSPAAWD